MKVRVLLAIEWMLATTLALVLAHLFVEIVGAALFGYALLFFLPFIGGVAGGLPVGILQWLVLRRHNIDDGRSWIVFTLIGFVGSWTVAMGLAALLFVPPTGLDPLRAFLAFATPTPIIGWAQSRVLRRWSHRSRLWVLASTAGWGGFFAVEIFRNPSLPVVNQLGGRLVSAVAGYAVASTVGATLLGGAVAGAITGIALAVTLPRTPTEV